MSQELLYTSAPQGLKPGSRGFCTVVSTQGMASTLAECLESLSGYRHAFPIHGPQANLNPVNYSHLIVTVGGRRYHVLSRVANAGQDYTGRTNKLAHHVALDVSERVPGGPGWVLADEQFCVRQWDGQTRLLAQGRSPRRDRPPQRPCQAWKKQTGDAGWAGVLAQWTQEGKTPIYIVFPPGTDTLSLVVEALNLLPESKRWEVTFSTYFTKLPPGISCRWRFVLDGSPEVTQARRDPRHKVLDLCRDLGPAPDGPLVQAARTGKLPAAPQPSSAPTSRPATPEPGPPRPAPLRAPELAPLQDDPIEVLDQDPGDDYPLAVEVQRPPSLPASGVSRSRFGPPAGPASTPKQPSRDTAQWLKLLAVALIALLLGVGGTIGVLLWTSAPQKQQVSQPAPIKQIASTTSPQGTPNTSPSGNKQPKPSPSKDPQESKNKNPQDSGSSSNNSNSSNSANNNNPQGDSSSGDSGQTDNQSQNSGDDPGTPPAPSTKESKDSSPPKKPRPDPLALLKEAEREFHGRFGDNYLLPLKLPPLPDQMSPDALPVLVWSESGEKEVRFENSENWVLSLLCIHPENDQVPYVLQETSSSPRTWKIVRRTSVAPEETLKIATIQVDTQGRMLFQWEPSIRPDYAKDIQRCLLKFHSEKDKENTDLLCALIYPLPVDPFPLFSGKTRKSYNLSRLSYIGGLSRSEDKSEYKIHMDIVVSQNKKMASLRQRFVEEDPRPADENLIPDSSRSWTADLPLKKTYAIFFFSETEPELVAFTKQTSVASAELKATLRKSRRDNAMDQLEIESKNNYYLHKLEKGGLIFREVKNNPAKVLKDVQNTLEKRIRILQVEIEKEQQQQKRKKKLLQKAVEALKESHKLNQRRAEAWKILQNGTAIHFKLFWNPQNIFSNEEGEHATACVLLLYTQDAQDPQIESEGKQGTVSETSSEQ